MKRFFLTLDLEEWYHLEYLKGSQNKVRMDFTFVDKVLPILNALSGMGIYATVFVVKEAVIRYPELVKEIHKLGHEIACHGYNHELVYSLSENEFRYLIADSKDYLESAISSPIFGYRAPCFSMTNAMLPVLSQLGFLYDASYIKFGEHALYNVMDAREFMKKASLFYGANGIYVVENPTIKCFNHYVPFSGGGYFRILPYEVYKYVLREYYKGEDNFVFYMHPFEIVYHKIAGITETGIKNTVRFSIGRRGFSEKLLAVLGWAKSNGVTFLRLCDYIEQLKAMELHK
jgi:polysaccharide deacetylase family protein (PEP-CTERM system associated)